jgi:hypothetical protein
MSQEEANIVLNLVFRYGFEAVVAGTVVFLLIKYFLPGYLSEKGKNLATKEDIRKITDEVESVKNQYAVLIEELKAKHQLRLAAIERRLQAHQEAFSLWRGLLSSMHSPEVSAEAAKCNSWWIQNCLYLEPSAREAFANAYHSAANHASLIQSREVEPVKENWNRIVSAGSAILQAAQLPGLTSIEKSEIAKLENHAK